MMRELMDANALAAKLWQHVQDMAAPNGAEVAWSDVPEGVKHAIRTALLTHVSAPVASALAAFEQERRQRLSDDRFRAALAMAPHVEAGTPEERANKSYEAADAILAKRELGFMLETQTGDNAWQVVTQDMTDEERSAFREYANVRTTADLARASVSKLRVLRATWNRRVGRAGA